MKATRGLAIRLVAVIAVLFAATALFAASASAATSPLDAYMDEANLICQRGPNGESQAKYDAAVVSLAVFEVKTDVLVPSVIDGAPKMAMQETHYQFTNGPAPVVTIDGVQYTRNVTNFGRLRRPAEVAGACSIHRPL